MDTSSEQFRKACEVRFVASKDKDWRLAFYIQVSKHRGEEAAKALAAAVKAFLLEGSGS